jgi:CRISPR-associated protein Csc3
MIHQRLLMQAVQDSDPVLVGFVQALAPKILEHFAIIPALGGSGKPRPAPAFDIPERLQSYTEEELQRFSRSNPDQSMATHILNGIFAGMRLAAKLPPNKEMTPEEKKLWILGYVVHDYTKVYGLKVPAGELPAIRLLVERLGEQMDFEKFLPDWKHWLDDVVWLGQNTQTKEGANLNLQDYPALRTPPRRLEVLRMLSSIADILVHIKSPALDAGTQANLRAKFAALFGADKAPRLAYHKLNEVRGLLSNIINNALWDILQKQGYEPYLFFPNGIIYLAENGTPAQLDAEPIVDHIWMQVADVLTSNEDTGIKRDGKGLKVSPAMYELLDLESLLRVGQKAALGIRNSSAIDRVGADRISQENLVADERTDRLAEFIIFTKRRIFDELFPKAKGVPEMLLSACGFEGKITVADTEIQNGGVLLGWWYVAARYMTEHRTLDEYELPEVLETLSKQAMAFIKDQKLEVTQRSTLRESFTQYVLRLIEVDANPLHGKRYAFADELSVYSERKVRNKPLCSLCSSPYISITQPETAVLFKPQQYSNKTRLGSNMVQRGICPICMIEMMLRLVQQGAPGKSFQDQKPVYIWLYPTYFFTTETAQVVKSYIGELQDLPIFKLLNSLRKDGFSLHSLLDFEGFVKGDEQESHSYTINRQPYSRHDNATLFNFALHPLGKSPTETDAWIVPTLYALVLPLLLDLKVVVTPSFVPIFGTGAEFHETAVLDAPHQFTRYALGQDRFRVEEILPHLIRLLELYDLHVDVFAESNDLHWNLINTIAKDVATDPYYIFSYFERKERNPKKKAELTTYVVNRYLEIYNSLGGEKDMGIIGEIVNAYAQFYRADWGKLNSAYAVLKPFSEAADVVIESDPKTDKEDLILLVAGAIGDLMERLWGNQAEGFDPIVFAKDSGLGGNERRTLSREKQMVFASLFVEKVFYHYCNGDRALLRERTNRLRAAARFYYLSNYGYTKKEANRVETL